MENVIFEKKDYRIIEIEDYDTNLEDLKGECYALEVNKSVDKDLLKAEESQFETYFYEKGVFGYVLEKWDPSLGKGWSHIDSCFGFIGDYKTEKHYIVDDFKNYIKEQHK